MRTKFEDKKRIHSFRLKPEEHQKLDVLSRTLKMSRSTLVGRLIQNQLVPTETLETTLEPK